MLRRDFVKSFVGALGGPLLPTLIPCAASSGPISLAPTDPSVSYVGRWGPSKELVKPRRQRSTAARKFTWVFLGSM